MVITSTFGNGSLEEITGLKAQPLGNTALLRILFEDRSYLRQVEADALQMSVVSRNLHREIALRRTNIGKRLVCIPGELPGHRFVRTSAEARHRAQEFLQPRRFSVQRFEQGQRTITSFVLRPSRSQRLG